MLCILSHFFIVLKNFCVCFCCKSFQKWTTTMDKQGKESKCLYNKLMNHDIGFVCVDNLRANFWPIRERLTIYFLYIWSMIDIFSSYINQFRRDFSTKGHEWALIDKNYSVGFALKNFLFIEKIFTSKYTFFLIF